MIDALFVILLIPAIAAVAVSEWQRSRGLPTLLERAEPTGAEYELSDD